MFLNDSYANVPGLSSSRETYENEFRWGPHGQGMYANGLIDGNTIDSGNSPTYLLRAGLLLGQVTATGKYTDYDKNATDGSEVASAVLLEGLRMTDFQGTAVDKFYAVLVGGPVMTSKLFNFDNMARQQMAQFTFDDIGQMMGGGWFPFKRFQSKTANYTVVGGDNYTLFDNTGAGGTVVLTLPAIANGYMLGIYCTAAQVVRFTSNEGSNVVGGGSLTNSSCSVTAIGGGVWIYTNPAGTKWYVEQHGTQTVTFS